MNEKYTVAVPSAAPGGLEAETSGHFGHCDVFTLVTIENGRIGEIALQPNGAHEQGGCMAPVMMLARRNVKALIAGGMGMRPLAGFNSVGIDVFFNNGLNRVDSVINAFVNGELPKFQRENVCGGGQGFCGGH